MKNKPLFITLLITAVLSSLAVFIKYSLSDLFGNIICFPFEQIAMGLRWMSLQSGLLNAVALMIYIIISASPLLVYFLHLRKKIEAKEDLLMVLLSFGLFYVLYMMINPGLMPNYGIGLIGNEMVKTLLCGTVYSIIFTYLVLRTIGIFFASETNKLYRYMVALLWMTAILLTISIFGAGFSDTILQIESIQASNVGTEQGLGTTYVFMILHFIVNSISALISILVIFIVIELIMDFALDSYSENVIIISHKLSILCKRGLILTVCSGMGLNILQIIFMGSLRNINSSIYIPLFSIIFILGVLIFSKMIISNKALKDDNDSII